MSGRRKSRRPEIGRAGGADTAASPAVTGSGPERPFRDHLFDLMAGYFGTWIVALGTELGIFRALAQAARPVPVEELARITDLDARYLGPWVEAALAFGLIEADADGSYLDPEQEEMLGRPDHRAYFASWAEIYVEEGKHALDLAARFRTGEPLPYASFSPRFKRLMRDSTVPSYHLLIDHDLTRIPGLEAQLRSGGTLLEVGCGGGYGLGLLAQRFDEAVLFGIEPDERAHQDAQAHLAELGVGERTTVLRRAAGGDPLPVRADVVLFHWSLHECSDPRDALRWAAGHLDPGGWMVIAGECALPEAGETRAAAREAEETGTARTEGLRWERLIWGEQVLFETGLEPVGPKMVERSDLERWSRGTQLGEWTFMPSTDDFMVIAYARVSDPR